MQGLDYQTVVGLTLVGQPGSEAEAYALDLGSVELEPISCATLLSLRERATTVRELLDRCFVDRPELWVDPEALDEISYEERLRELAAYLLDFDRRLTQAGEPCDAVLSQIVAHWRKLTLELAAPDPSVLAAYRRSAFGCIEALLQLLPEDARCAFDTRERLELGKARLARYLGVDPAGLGTASWRATDSPLATEDSAFVTWGIP